MKTLFILAIILISINAKGQKRIIDTAELIGSKRFQYVDDPKISPNGSYSSYSINELPYGHQTFVIHNNYAGKEFRQLDASFIAFTSTSKELFFKKGDTLNTFDLKKFKVTEKNVVINVKTSNPGDPRFLLQQQNEKSFVLIDLKSGEKTNIEGYTSLDFNRTETHLFAKRTLNGVVTELSIVDIATGSKQKIFQNSESQDPLRFIRFVSNAAANKICIVFQSGNIESPKTHYYYWELGNEKAKELASDQSSFLTTNQHLSNDIEFSPDEKFIVFRIIQNKLLKDDKKAAVNVWSYKDVLIQSFQLYALSRSEGSAYFTVCLNLKSKKVIQLTYDNESAEILKYGHNVLVKTNQYLGGASVPRFLRGKYETNFYLTSMDDGARILIGNYRDISDQATVSLSPDCKYLVFNNPLKNCFDSFDIVSKKRSHLTDSTNQTFRSHTATVTTYLPVSGVVAWEKSGKSCLVYDNFDIWMLDPSGLNAPFCLTKSFGKRMQTRFRLVWENKLYDGESNLLITAFDVTYKYNGLMFAKPSVNTTFKPTKLLPTTLFHNNSQLVGNAHEFSRNSYPIKAKNANLWLVSKEDASSSPNYFITKNFESFKPVSFVGPEKDYNWITSELIDWQPPLGPKLQGVLYKPENFDPHKRYPVIINFYEQLSHRLYEFPKPELAIDNINIPYLVSNGYLVLAADIHYEVGAKSNITVGEWALNAIESAAKHLATLPFINSDKIGIQGHSFGGMESAYIATHSQLFAAAMEASGATEPISHYLSIMNAFGGTQEYAADPNGIEVGHYLYGASLWERPDLYLRNSSILNANKITTPLLIMHNREDNSLNWHQGVALYLSMQRLQKPCWMLEYDHENHVLLEEKNALDYTIRMTQFFDHYLKGAPAPTWMTKGIPAKLKGIEEGYALDPGVEP